MAPGDIHKTGLRIFLPTDPETDLETVAGTLEDILLLSLQFLFCISIALAKI